MNKFLTKIGYCIAACSVIVMAQAPTGESVEPSSKEAKALAALKGAVKGKIVWTTSRANPLHQIWIMNADGTNPKQLTKPANNVDWYSRFSPDGKKVLFCRSKMGWVKEVDAKVYDKWDVWTINVDGTDEKMVAESATWGTWRPDGKTIVFARGGQVFTKDLETNVETKIFDADTCIKKGADAQQPNMSADGKFLAMTVRGSGRETGIWNFEKKIWNTTGAGCQIDFFPFPEHPDHVYRMNEINYNTQVLRIAIDADGKPTDKVEGLSVPKNIIYMDLPGRRTHEYFPRVDRQTGTWMVWCATQEGHDHDMYDYEVFVWKINPDMKKEVTRLTFHSGNDRWPDIFIEQ